MTWLTVRSNDGADPLPRHELESFHFEGERVPLIDRQRGIRKPAILEAALSIITVYRAEGTTRPYEDGTGSDGLIRYKWRGLDPDHAENRALRVAMERRLPLIWFVGVAPGWFQPVFPVYVAGEEPQLNQFALAVDEVFGLVEPETHLEAQLRRYVERVTKQRLHQPVFRSTVLRAYTGRCAVCALAHRDLLDAAHIVPDSHERGEASVRNGLALCKLHHSAFDNRYLGVTPDLTVHIRQDILEEQDGPTLLHGLQRRHGQKLMVLPGPRSQYPSKELLEITYRRFLEPA
ncbi:HNH endonuclease [Ornithinimicrobium tianjinense]|nr:HNH endonuclease [Ornithinimicrobium tianjinense]